LNHRIKQQRTSKEEEAARTAARALMKIENACSGSNEYTLFSGSSSAETIRK
jgi:hypothetical protein